jgi:hypothetical protein
MQCVYIKRNQTQCSRMVRKVGENKCAEHRKTGIKKPETEELKEEIKKLEPLETPQEVKKEVKKETKEIKEPKEIKEIKKEAKETITEKLNTNAKAIKKIITFKSADDYIKAVQLIENYIVKK